MNQKSTVPRINLPVQGEPTLEVLLARVADPADLNALARDFLYVFLLHGKQAVQRLNLTENEALALLDTVTGVYIAPHMAHLLAAELEDALECGLAEQWSIDGKALLWRLDALSPFEVAAVALTLKSTWDVRQRYEGDLLKAARAVGLLPTDQAFTT